MILALIFDGNYRARLDRSDAVVPIPADFETLFERDDSHRLTFRITDVVLDSHFFGQYEIEFSFVPAHVTQSALERLLAFMVDIGDALGSQ